MRPCGVVFRDDACGSWALDLIDLLVKHLPDDREDLEHMKEVFVSGKIELNAFLDVVFANQANDVVSMIRKNNLRQDLATFFAVYLARPPRAAAAEMLLEDMDLKIWKCGYCPVCGHWPAISHIHDEEGHRHLWCLHCGTVWPFRRLVCPFCTNHDHTTLEIIKPIEKLPYQAQVCNKCKRYVKEVRTGLSIDDFPFDTVYLSTLAIDLAVAEEGYLQESPLSIRYDDPEGNELLMYRQELSNCGP